MTSALTLNLNFMVGSARSQLESHGFLKTTSTTPSHKKPSPSPSINPTYPKSPPPATVYSSPVPTIPWGTTEKIGEHTYRTYVGDDPEMSTVDELHTALNFYRRNHGVGEVVVSDSLCKLADIRISQLKAIGGLDAHKGFKDYLEVQSNWENLPRFVSLGENNSYGYRQSGTHLIEWVFDSDEEHKGNQLNPNWNRVCSRIDGTIVEMVFGMEK